MDSFEKDDDYAPVEGGRIASRILSKFPAARREEILHRIAERSPEALGLIREHLLTFSDLEKASSGGIQRLIREVSHEDLLLALRHTSNQLKAFFLKNMSDRKARMVIQDLHAMGKRPLKEVETAQSRIMERVDELRTAGLFQLLDESDDWVS